MINYEDFAKLDLRVADIVEADRVEGSQKLIKLKVKLASEERQIIAGIGKSYQPEDLIDRQIIIVANLEPRRLMGLESQGMLLAAGDAENLALLQPDKKISSDTKVG